MPGLAPFAPALAGLVLGTGAMVDQNVQNKAAIKNAQNAETTAQNNATNAQNTAQGNLGKYLSSTPGPAQAGAFNPAAASSYSGANVPMVPSPQGGAAGGTQLSPQVVALLAQLKGGALPGA